MNVENAFQLFESCWEGLLKNEMKDERKTIGSMKGSEDKQRCVTQQRKRTLLEDSDIFFSDSIFPHER
jgi:hypothetical protein